MRRGHYVIVLLLLLGIGAAGVAIGVRHSQLDRALEYWSPRDALLIRDAVSIELLTLSPEDPNSPPSESAVAQLLASATQRLEMRGRPGTSHLWHALLQDDAYDWSRTAPAARPQWTHALVFRRGARRVQALLELDHGWLQKVDHGPALSIEPLLPFARRVLIEDTRRERDSRR